MLKAIARFFDRLLQSKSGDFFRRVDDLNAGVHGGKPTIGYGEIGELPLPSGTLLLGDPMYGPPDVRIENIGSHRVTLLAEMWEYPNGAAVPRRLDCVFEGGRESNRRQTVGMIGVDSGCIVLADHQDMETHWTDTGIDRIGVLPTVHDPRMSALLKKQFGLKVREASRIEEVVTEPVSEALEAEITAYLESIPECADYPFLYFRVCTNGSFERANRDHGPGAFIPIGNDPKPEMLVCRSGRGDGHYEVICDYDGDIPCRASITFIEDEDG